MLAEPLIYTIGHSTRPIETFVELLRAHAIRTLVDVRTVPRSRRNPQFNQEALPASLAAVGIDYVHAPELGGLRRPRKDSINTAWRHSGFRGYADYMQTPEFAESVDPLIARARDTRVALMCAEAVPWRCHRSLLADTLTARGVSVGHILSASRAQPHLLTKFARVEDTRVTYPAQETLDLPLDRP